MYYKDDFNVTFEEESAFYKYLDDVEKRTKQGSDSGSGYEGQYLHPDWEYQSGIFKRGYHK